jgi:hypothetical protein
MASVTAERAVRHVLVHYQRLTPPETRHACPLAGGLFRLLVCVRHRCGGLAISCGRLAAMIAPPGCITRRRTRTVGRIRSQLIGQMAHHARRLQRKAFDIRSRHPRHDLRIGGSDLGYRQLGHPEG